MKNFLGQPRIPGMSQDSSSPPPHASEGLGAAPAMSTAPAFDIKQYFHVIVKRIWVVALCFILALSITVILLMRQVPVYRSTATLLLTRGIPVPTSLRVDEIQPISGDYLSTQQRIIYSGIVLRGARERVGRSAEELNEQVKRVSVDLVPKTSMINIVVDSLDPVVAAEFANAVAEEYLDFKMEQRRETSQATVISLTQQANRIREELTRSEERMIAYERENNIVAIRERGNVAAKSLGALSSRAADYRTQRLLLEFQQPLIDKASSDEVVLTALASSGASIGSPAMVPLLNMGGTPAVEGGAQIPGLGDPSRLIDYGIVKEMSWTDLRRQKSKLESEITALREHFHDEHPQIQEKLGRIRDIDRSLDVELQFALREFYSKLEALKIQEEASAKAMSQWEDEAVQLGRTMREYENVERSVTRLRGLYDVVFNRLREVNISLGIETESISIIERARPSASPTAPRKMQTIFIAALLGLGAGIGIVFGLEFLDDSIRYPEEVASTLQLPFFGVIPSANWDPDDLRSHMLSNIDQKSGLAEAYRNVRSAFMYNAGPSSHAIVVTSAVPKEGKTTTCLNLSVSLAQAGQRVLLVDGDLRRGELHKFFGLEGGRGLSDVLAGQAKPEAVIQRTGLPNLDLMATGPFPPNPAELMLRPELYSFLEYAKRTYDRVLFDAPPVMAVSEASILAALVDGCVFVVWAGQTSRKLSGRSVQILRERGANLYGAVLNNLEYARVGYYYYSTYYGYYDYDYRYDKDT